MAHFHSSEVIEALTLIGAVHNCNMLNWNDPEVHEHYDCLEDIKKARDILNAIIENETDKILANIPL